MNTERRELLIQIWLLIVQYIYIQACEIVRDVMTDRMCVMYVFEQLLQYGYIDCCVGANSRSGAAAGVWAGADTLHRSDMSGYLISALSAIVLYSTNCSLINFVSVTNTIIHWTHVYGYLTICVLLSKYILYL